MKLHRLLVAVIFALASYLSLARLNEPAFWDDEAHVAIFARNFLKTGHWSAWDGRNLVPDRNGSFLNARLNHCMPQLDYPLVAASFRLFGVSTWAGRFPFALAGLATLAAFYWLLRLEFPGAPLLHLYAFAGLALSVNFLLSVRTCRYYAAAMLLVVAACLCYRRFLQTHRRFCAAGLAVTSMLLFFSSALICAAFLLALLARHLVFHRRQMQRRDWLALALCAAVFVGAVAPYLVGCVLPYSAASRPDEAARNLAQPTWLSARFTLLWWNLREINADNLFPWLLALPLACSLVAARHSASILPPAVREWALLALTFVFFLVLFSPPPGDLARVADTRYLVPLLPILAGLGGASIRLVHRFSRPAAITLLALFVATNALAFIPWQPHFRWLLPALVGEIHRPYPTACSEVAKFLQSRARQDESVFACPDFMNKPLCFYLGDKLRFAGCLNCRTPLPLETLRQLKAPLFLEENFPDWIVAFGWQAHAENAVEYFSRPYQHGGRTSCFAYRQTVMLDVFCSQTQRPELHWHNFGPLRDFDPHLFGVSILRRSDPEAEPK